MEFLGKICLYRKDILDEFDIPYPKNDWTWDDLYENCVKLTDPEKGTYGMALGLGASESWFWVTFLWSAGGEVMVYDKSKDEWKADFDSNAAVKALDFYTRLSAKPWKDKEGRQHYGYAMKDGEIGTKWNEGKIGYKFSYIDEKMFAQINPDVVGMVAVPKGPGGHRGGEINSRMQGIFAGIKEPAVRDAAWEYMRYIDSKEASATRTKNNG